MNPIICLQIFNKGGFCLTCSIYSQITCIFVAQKAEAPLQKHYTIQYKTLYYLCELKANKTGKPKADSTEDQNVQSKASPTPSFFLLNPSSSPQYKCHRQILSQHTQRRKKMNNYFDTKFQKCNERTRDCQWLLIISGAGELTDLGHTDTFHSTSITHPH